MRSKLDGAFCHVGLQDSFLVKGLGMGSLGMVSGGWHGRGCLTWVLEMYSLDCTDGKLQFPSSPCGAFSSFCGENPSCNGEEGNPSGFLFYQGCRYTSKNRGMWLNNPSLLPHARQQETICTAGPIPSRVTALVSHRYIDSPRFSTRSPLSHLLFWGYILNRYRGCSVKFKCNKYTRPLGHMPSTLFSTTPYDGF